MRVPWQIRSQWWVERWLLMPMLWTLGRLVGGVFRASVNLALLNRRYDIADERRYWEKRRTR